MKVLELMSKLEYNICHTVSSSPSSLKRCSVTSVLQMPQILAPCIIIMIIINNNNDNNDNRYNNDNNI